MTHLNDIPRYTLEQVSKWSGVSTERISQMSSPMINFTDKAWNRLFSGSINSADFIPPMKQDPVIEVKETEEPRYSFKHLIQLHTISALLPFTGISIAHLREVRDYLLVDELDIRLPLTSPLDLFKDPDISISKKQILSAAIRYAAERVEHSMTGDNPVALFSLFYPYYSNPEGYTFIEHSCPDDVKITPSVLNGQPYVGNNKPTRAIANHYKAEGGIKHLAFLYDTLECNVEAAIMFEFGTFDRNKI